MTTTQAKPEEKALATNDSPASRFTNAVMREFASITGAGIAIGEDQKRLAQHLFLKIDSSLKELETKRLSKSNAADTKPIVWANINMQKLAVDAMYRIDLGLDALIPNHISPIPYWNGREGKYDLDLRIGYTGKDFYRRRFAIDPPDDIRYELVYSTDKFSVKKRSFNTLVETYEFEVTNPFDRGEVVGGFGYVMYDDDPAKNFVITASEKEFKRRKGMAKSNEFWDNHPDAMRFKTLVNIVTGRLATDPAKTTPSYQAIEAEYEAEDEGRAQAAIDQGMAAGQLLEPGKTEAPKTDPEPQPQTETKQEPAKKTAPFL